MFDVTRQVGLAVGDIDKIQQNALMDRYVLQVSILGRSLELAAINIQRPHLLSKRNAVNKCLLLKIKGKIKLSCMTSPTIYTPSRLVYGRLKHVPQLKVTSFFLPSHNVLMFLMEARVGCVIYVQIFF